VQTGRLYDGMRVIEGGLKKNERVVVKGLQRVRPGAKVEAELAPMPTGTSRTKAGPLASAPTPSAPAETRRPVKRTPPPVKTRPAKSDGAT
jgi:hypothetical protein